MKKKAMLYDKVSDDTVRCRLCAHRCLISDGNFGVCGMRQCTGGELFTFSYGNIVASHIDPIEKKPLYHFLPGSSTYSIAGAGCNFKCSFCQNWQISTLSALKGDLPGKNVKTESVVRDAVESGSGSISYTYTEPTIFFEYAYETAEAAVEAGLRNIFVTNGYMTSEAADKISPFLNAANIDLKFFNEDAYRKICGASLSPVLETISKMKSLGIWIEVTTLIIPGLNDREKDIHGISDFLAGLDTDIPWHISAFHPDHMMRETPGTPPDIIDKAKRIGYGAGLRHIYPGNLTGPSDTVCPVCGSLLIERSGYFTRLIDGNFGGGKCLSCGEKIKGVWL